MPVGRDQLPHLELAREIVRRFNRHFGETFPEPEAELTNAPAVVGLDGTNKMSKSLNNHVEIASSEEETEKRVRSAVTDTQRRLRSDPGRPEVCNVYSLHEFFDPEKRPWIYEQCTTAGIGCVDCKGILADAINDFLPADPRATAGAGGRPRPGSMRCWRRGRAGPRRSLGRCWPRSRTRWGCRRDETPSRRRSRADRICAKASGDDRSEPADLHADDGETQEPALPNEAPFGDAEEEDAHHHEREEDRHGGGRDDPLRAPRLQVG